VFQQRNKNLFFSTEVREAIERAQIIFIAVNTPPKEYGTVGATGYDLTAYESASLSIAQYARSSKIVVEKSTVPVCTADRIRTVFDSNRTEANLQFEIISNPEFLAEGTAIANLERPDRILIGGRDTPTGSKAVKLLKDVYKHWIEEDKIITSNLWSSELAKLACNAFLAQRVSSINALTTLCEKTGADIEQVAKVVGSDSRIGSGFLRASVGFGGSCFGKDLLGLIYLCEVYHLQEEANYWKQVLLMNNHQKFRFAKNIVLQMFGTVRDKNICVFGFAFKKDTGDFRDSAAIDVIRILTEEKANVFIYDPQVPVSEINRLFPDARVERDPYAAAISTHAIALVTEWDEFKSLDYARIFNTMYKPAFLFDGRNVLNHNDLRKIGFKVFAIGKSQPQTTWAHPFD
jgi:UDPglucose 6-dehydrogenase